MEFPEIESFLTHLAIEFHVTAATQNKAENICIEEMTSTPPDSSVGGCQQKVYFP